MQLLPGRYPSLVFVVALAMAAVAGPPGLAQPQQPWTSADLLRIRTVGEVRISPDGKRIAYTVQSNSRTGRPASQIWIWDRAAGTTARLGGERDSGTNLRWSPDSQSLAFTGQGRRRVGADGAAARRLPRAGARRACSPRTTRCPRRGAC